jgi:TIR domain
MASFRYDAFVSYPRADLARVKPLVQALQHAQLQVYWDQMLLPGEVWPVMLEQAIATSRYTLVCVTPGAVNSSFIEAEMKRSDGKLIPIWLENVDLPLIWEARIGRIQRADLRKSQFSQGEPQFAQLCAIIAGRTPTIAIAAEETLEARARRLIENSSVRDRSLIIALAIMGGAATDDISLLAADFEQRFRALFSNPAEQGAIALESLPARLRQLGAEIFVRPDQRFGVTVECARFADPALGHTILALAWSDYEQLRRPILSWIKEWSGESPRWIRLRLALNLGVLAQDERRFDAIWRLILQPMLFENARRVGRAARERFEVADAALSIAALDPSRGATVEAILNEMIAEQEGPKRLLAQKGAGKTSAAGDISQTPGTAAQATTPPAVTATVPTAGPAPASSGAGTPPQVGQANADHGDARDDLAGGGSELARIYVVARLAFGYTGGRYMDLAVRALRRLADRGSFGSLTNILSQSFLETMSSARGMAEGSLWDPIDILTGILRWAADVPRSEQPLPLTIFVLGLADLPLASDKDDLLSLTSIMRSKRGIETMRRGFLLGLALPDTRETFEDRLRQWRDDQRRDPVDPDPLKALVCALICGATSERDRARVRFIFRKDYDDASIEALARQVPELSGGSNDRRTH